METTLTQDVGQAHSDNKPAHAQDGIDSTGQDPGQDPGPEVLDTTLTEDVLFERLILFNVLKSFNPYKLSDLQHVLELRTIKGLLTDDDLIESYFKQTWKFKDDDFWLAGWKTMGLKKLVEEIRAAHPNVTGAPMSVGGELFKPHERALLESEVTKAALLRTWGCLRYVPQRVYANALVGLEVIRAVSTKASINKLRRQKQRWVLISTDVHSHVLTLSPSLSHSRFARSERFARSHQYFEWACPAGLVTKGQVVGLCLLSLAFLILACWNLAPLTRWLWPLVVIPFLIYPYMKRFTWACHLWLGLCIGLAPVAAYVAIADAVPLASFWLLGVVGFWIAGFDIIYATMDVEHDVAEGIHSAPADFGVGRALWFARVLHVLSIVSMVGVGVWAGLAWPYWVAVAACAALLIYEHAIVREDDLSKVNQAFFNVNVILAFLYLAGVVAALVVA